MPEIVEELTEALEEGFSVKNREAVRRYARLFHEYAVGRREYEEDIGRIKSDVHVIAETMREGFARGDARFAEFDARFEQVNHRFEQVDRRFEQVDKRFEQVDKRFEQVDKRFEELREDMNARFAQSDKRFDQMLAHSNARFEQVDKRFEQVDKRFEELRSDMNIRFRNQHRALMLGLTLLVTLMSVYEFIT
jgi:chaperonin cofactor prefoldin